jgi:hypothetical protein
MAGHLPQRLDRQADQQSDLLAQVCVMEAHIIWSGGCAAHDLLQGGGGMVRVQLKGLQDKAEATHGDQLEHRSK